VKINATTTFSQPGTMFLVLALAAGCGSVGAKTDDGATGSSNGGAAGHGVGGSSSSTDGGAGHGGGGMDGGGRTDGSHLDRAVGTPGLPVNLASAGTYAILAETGISTVPASAITGNLGISPYAAASITQFSLVADSTNVFSTSVQVTGKIYASDYAVPTPSNLTSAVGDMELAFTDAAGRAPDVTELGAGSIGGMTLGAGVYQWGSSLLIPTDITLNGNATAVWIFQIAQNLTLSSATRVNLTGGALAKNVFWQVAGSVEVGTTAHLEGIVLCKTMINLRTGATMSGRLFAQSAVTLDASTIVQPAP
jgi:hypothetical protein